ncbi:cupin domain-containing protein [Chitinivorax sp. B]|uniref:cupin domain-containing protein n=1 Tax=Chitinivorax sp. B TaxID=2502235 RepID=UPI0010F579D2|nr:cupin domain-containing protein [Chitinivorax sp. B]
MTKRITAFSQQNPQPTYDRPRADRLVVGNPQRTTWHHFTSADGIMDCGIWACEPGIWQIAFSDNKDEFFCVIEGVVRLHDANGQVTEVRAGESAVIPAGFIGQFEVVEAVCKYYVIVERK